MRRQCLVVDEYRCWLIHLLSISNAIDFSHYPTSLNVHRQHNYYAKQAVDLILHWPISMQMADYLEIEHPKSAPYFAQFNLKTAL